MSTIDEENVALRQTWEFLLQLGSGYMPVTGHVTELRREARRLLRHYPIGGYVIRGGDDGVEL